MKYLSGLLIAVAGFYFAGSHLNQTLGDFWDFVAFFLVLFGTIPVLSISFPSTSVSELMGKFFHKAVRGSGSIRDCANKCAQSVSTSVPLVKPLFIEEQLLNDGLELISLGFTKDKIEELLSQRYQNYAGKITLLSQWFKRNSKYPPAFGLMGTVLGLIHVMRGISNGLETKEVGVRMAVALVATLYGLIVSNLILNPIGEWLLEELKKDHIKAEMAILSIINLKEDANLLEIQELLNSYLEPKNRLDLISGALSEQAA